MEREALYLLTGLGRYPPVCSIADLGREIEYFDPGTVMRPLHNAGLIHKTSDGFVFATQAAFRMVQMGRPRRLKTAMIATSQALGAALMAIAPIKTVR